MAVALLRASVRIQPTPLFDLHSLMQGVRLLTSARLKFHLSQTLFLYLNDVPEGGRTNFFWLDGSDSIPGAGIFQQCIGDLCSAGDKSTEPAADVGGDTQGQMLSFAPKAGTAVIHFPTTTLEFGCVPDPRTMHESEAAIDTKHIVQQFIWPVPIDGHPPPTADLQHEDVRREWAALFRLARGTRTAHSVSDSAGHARKLTSVVSHDSRHE